MKGSCCEHELLISLLHAHVIPGLSKLLGSVRTLMSSTKFMNESFA